VDDGRERAAKTNPSSASSSPAANIILSGPFDPDGDTQSNAVSWNPQNGNWAVRDFTWPGGALIFGQLGDSPFTYKPLDASSNVGVVRIEGKDLLWLFNGTGFTPTSGTPTQSLEFGNDGDIPVPGPWERAEFTSPAVLRLTSQGLELRVYLRNGTVRTVPFGARGDAPRFADYDGDGLFDVAFYRPGNKRTTIDFSSPRTTATFSLPANATMRAILGDFTGDAGKADIAWFDDSSGTFFVLRSEDNYSQASPLQVNLGSTAGRPLSFYEMNNRALLMLLDGNARRFRAANNPSIPVETITAGAPSDAQS
jgi:hypothetical protein